MLTTKNETVELHAQDWIEEYSRQRERGVTEHLATERAHKIMRKRAEEDLWTRVSGGVTH